MRVPDWEKEAAKEISQFVAELVRKWVEFRGHEEAIAAIIAKHATPVTPPRSRPDRGDHD